MYAFEEEKKYFTIELDTDEAITWGTYRAVNHHKIPYFEMTFISSQNRTNKGDTVLVVIPTFYSYAYDSHIQGIGDTINDKKQNIRFFFHIRDKGKKLEYIELDSLTRAKYNQLSLFNKKEEVDITSIPPIFTLTKKPDWSKFQPELRTSLARRLKELKKRAVRD